MLDTGRKFFPVHVILDLLTVLYEHNFNVFHWHIYDAESFPLLWPPDRGLTDVSIGYSHSPHYYTPGDISTVIMYAQKLGILVYPESDMPGHSDIWYVPVKSKYGKPPPSSSNQPTLASLSLSLSFFLSFPTLSRTSWLNR